MTRTLLAFDTSTDLMSLALTGPHGVLLHESAGGAQASARLIPEVLALLREAACTLASVDAIAFGCGPGAFTGLRTACSVAQGLAFGAGKPVIPIDSLLLVAEAARFHIDSVFPLDIWVAMDARMGEVYGAAYRCSADTGAPRWQVVSAPALYAPAALADAWRQAPPSHVAGSALSALSESLGLDGVRTQLVPDPGSRAAALSRLAPALWAQGLAVDAARALPVYVRDKVAQTTLERDAIRRAREVLA